MIKQEFNSIEYLRFLLPDSHYARTVLESIMDLLEIDEQDGEVEFLDWVKVMKEAYDFEMKMKSAAHAFGVARGFLLSMAEESDEQEGEEQ
jgi:hypothetical protein